MKTDFELRRPVYGQRAGIMCITEEKGILVTMFEGYAFGEMKGKELETFAVNILKALKSKHLKLNQ